MAVELHKVVYHDGTERVKQLTREDAERIGEQRGVKSITKMRGPAQNKTREAQSNRGGIADPEGVDAAAHVDEELTREANEAKTQAANENTDQSTALPRTGKRR